MNKVKVAYIILVIIFIMWLIPFGIAIIESMSSDSLIAAVGITGILLTIVPVILHGSLVYLTSDYSRCE
jgi:hypothetical protein